MRGNIMRLLRGRMQPLGSCPGCHTTVFHDDDWLIVGLGYAHRECAGHAGRALGLSCRLCGTPLDDTEPFEDDVHIGCRRSLQDPIPDTPEEKR